MRLDEVIALAKELETCRTLPDHIKTRGDIVATILRGQELGFGPMTSLRVLTNIRGKEIIDAATMLGLMSSRAGWLCTWAETTHERAELRIEREGRAHTIAFSIQDAKKAGLTGGNWAKRPDAMLRARCASKAARMYAPEAMAGVYTPDEGEEIAAVTAASPVAELVSEGDPEMAERIAEANGVRDEEKTLIDAWDEDLATVAKDADSLLQWVHFNAAEIDGLDHRVKGRFLTVVKRHGERVGFAISTKRKDVDLEPGQNYRRLKQAIADGCNDEGPPPPPEPPTAQDAHERIEEAQALIEDVFAESLGER